MLIKKTLTLLSACSIALTIAACTEASPRLGETVNQANLGDDVTITGAETRRLLPNGKIAGSNSALIHSESIVEKIDYKSRVVRIKSSESEAIEIKAGEEVKNFNQIKVGDKVSIDYLVAVAFEVRKPTAEELAVAGDALQISAKAKVGTMPAAGTSLTSVKIAVIEAINKDAGTITLKNTTSTESVTLKAKYPENLSFAKVGDTIVISTLEAYATEVNKVP